MISQLKVAWLGSSSSEMLWHSALVSWGKNGCRKKRCRRIASHEYFFLKMPASLCYTGQKKETLIICMKAQNFSLAWLEKNRKEEATGRLQKSEAFWQQRDECFFSKRCIWLYTLLSLPTFSCIILPTCLHDLSQNIVQAGSMRVN